MKLRRCCPAAIVACLAAASTGCLYHATRPFREDVRTVFVEMAQSREFRRDLEFELTESLVKRINLDTPYRIADRRDADTVLTCEILGVQNRGFANNPSTQRPVEVGSTIYIRYRWKDQRTGDILVERPRFAYSTSYLPPLGETFQTGMVRGMDGLAEQIVETMEIPW